MSGRSLGSHLAGSGSEFKLRLYLLLARKGMWDWLSWDNTRISFIVSTGRTGTKALALFLDQQDGVAARHEPWPAFLELGLSVALGEVSLPEAKRRFATDRKVELLRLQRLRPAAYVEANNRLFSLVPVILELFKDARVVHIVRDGRDVVRSGMSRPWYRADDMYPSRLSAIDFPDDPYHDEWERMSRFEKVCWLWQKKDGIIQEAVKDEANCVTLRFESIFDRQRGYPGLKEMMAFMGLDSGCVSSLVLHRSNVTESFAIPHWQKWDRRMKDSFLRVAGRHMARYGYLDGSGW